MAYQALILLAVAASASAQSYASSYNSIADPLQGYSPSAPSYPSAPHAQAPSPLSYSGLGASAYGGSAYGGSAYGGHQLLLQQPGYDVTEAPQEPESPPSPVPPPAPPVSFGPLPQNLPLIAQPQPQPQPQQYLSQHELPSAPAQPSLLTSHSSTSFSSPYASYQH